MPRLAVHTALASLLALGLGLPAAAQQGADCPAASFDTDANGDGMIGADEARSAAEREFARFDRDSDNRIARDEFIGCYAAGLKPQVAPKQQEASAAPRDEASFAALDADRDGRIDRAEFARGAEQAFAPGLPPDSERDENIAVPDGQTTGDPDEVTVSEAGAAEAAGSTATAPEAGAAAEDETGPAATAEAQDAGGAVTAAEAGASAQPDTLASAEGRDAGEPGANAPAIVHERFLQSPFADFPSAAGEPLTPEAAAFHTAMLFRALDIDGDHALTSAEWMQVAPSVSQDPATLENLFQALDGDGDNAVDASEYVGALMSAHAEAASAGGPGQQETDAAATGSAAADEQVSTGRSEPAGDGSVPVFVYRLYRY